MEAGIKNEKSIVVTEDVTASKVGSGLLPVYATPSMIALMEGTCAESVQSELAKAQLVYLLISSILRQHRLA